MLFNSWGYINSFSLFQAYYTTALNEAPSTISWIGSIQIFLTLFVGTFSGRALDAGYYRHVALVGLVLQVLGIFMTSLVTKYWHLLLAQGICQGLGSGLVFTPTVALVSTYFSKKRAVAVSCMTAGTATGGIVFPVIARQLLDKVGFAWTLRVMGFIMLANSAIVLALVRTRCPARSTGPLIELAAFADPWYSFFGLGLLLASLGLYFGYYYVSPPNRLPLPSLPLTCLVDYPFCSGHHPRLFSNVSRPAPCDERNGTPRPNCAGLDCGSLSRVPQYSHHHDIVLRHARLRLGCCGLFARHLGVCCTVRIFWIRDPNHVSSSASQFPKGLVKDRRTNGHGLFPHGDRFSRRCAGGWRPDPEARG